MQIAEPAEQKRAKKKGRNEKDLKTCFIIAGCSGAGKSTIVKHSHALDVKLFGKEFHEDFKKTRSGSPHQEFDKYSDAIRNGSTFEGRHIKNLKDEKDPPKHILMHVDLKLLIRTLGHRAASENDKRKIKSLTKFPTPHEDRVNPMVCDLLVSSFLKHQFFSKFDVIVINTVYIDWDKNYVQKMKRDRPNEKIKSNKKSEIFSREHHAMYEAWERNIYLLKPSRIFFTTVCEDGGLYSNNKCICPDWTSQVSPNNDLNYFNKILTYFRKSESKN